MPRTFSIVLLVWLMALGATIGARAQAATPAADPLFSDLGLPELVLTATDDGLTLSQTEVSAGRYLVTLNDNSRSGLLVEFVRSKPKPPPSSLGANACSYQLPLQCLPWYLDAYLPGGVSTDSPQAVLDLKGGVYQLWGPACCDRPAARLLVSGDPDTAVAGTEPPGPVVVIALGTGGRVDLIRVEGALAAGPQLVQIVNETDQPLTGGIAQYPGPITVAQVEEMFRGDPCCGATPSPDALDSTLFRRVASYGPLSAGAAQWVLVDVNPGQIYISGAVPAPGYTDTNPGWSTEASAVVPVEA